jgi:hypothetical protein
LSLGGVILFKHKVVADLFEKDFDYVGAFAVVINNQDASLLFHRRTSHIKASCVGILPAVSPLFS